MRPVQPSSFLPLLLLSPEPRAPPAASVASGSYGSDDWNPEAAASPPPPPAINRWRQMNGCEVLLPDEGVRCTGLIHFVGGALAGSAPTQAYGPFLEAIGAGGGSGIGVVATPVGLSGLDHFGAAREAMLRWCAVQQELDQALFLRGDPSSSVLPVLGLGHSLGAKLLLLLGSDPKMCEAMGPPRVANILVAYNNFNAARSIPLFSQASKLADAAQRGRLSEGVGEAAAYSARDFLSAAGTIGATLGAGASSLLREMSDSVAQGGWESSMGVAREDPAAEQLRSFVAGGLGESARRFDQLGKEAVRMGERASAASAASGGGAEEADFTPSPADTDALVAASYSVRRNLVIKFTEDDIDQSSELARLLAARFTDEATGIGGRLDFKRLGGSHVTPNAPRVAEYVAGIDWGLTAQLGMEDAANAAVESVTRSERERDVACGVITQFAEREIGLAT
ncbi:MAG: hypothetical protein SGPRY_006975 [Prymnesium sp.]